jgi:phage baseplate assembly protein W
MEPDFGVGIKTFLFELHDTTFNQRLESAIKKQTALYMPLIQIEDIFFDASEMDRNSISIAIKYSLPKIGATDLLQFTI